GTIAGRYFRTADEAAMLPSFDAFVAAGVPAATRARAVSTASMIRYRAGLRDRRVPSADEWIAARSATR
ncbi:MAG: hypothetical protein ABJD97_22525, partial [Betaproteobacteria bacterium]